MNIAPISYGSIVEEVSNSDTTLVRQILNLKPEDLKEQFMAGVANLAAVIGHPITAAVPHSIANGCKNLLVIAAAIDVESKEATIKQFIKNPTKFVASVAFAAATTPLANLIRTFRSKSPEYGFNVYL